MVSVSLLSRLTVLAAVLSTALCGCATMQYPRSYKVEGKEFREFSQLDDDKALKLVAQIYNVKHETWEDNMARSIALDEYISLLRKRKSMYIKKSGIFNIKYDKVKVSSWKKEELEKLYDLLEQKAYNYHMESSYKLTENENAQRITYLTALSCVATELERRENTDKAMGTAAQILVGVVGIALSLI